MEAAFSAWFSVISFPSSSHVVPASLPSPQASFPSLCLWSTVKGSRENQVLSRGEMLPVLLPSLLWPWHERDKQHVVHWGSPVIDGFLWCKGHGCSPQCVMQIVSGKQQSFPLKVEFWSKARESFYQVLTEVSGHVCATSAFTPCSALPR